MNPERSVPVPTRRRMTRDEAWVEFTQKYHERIKSKSMMPSLDLYRFFLNRKKDFEVQRAQGLLSAEYEAQEQQIFKNHEDRMKCLLYGAFYKLSQEAGVDFRGTIKDLIDREEITLGDVSFDDVLSEETLRRFSFLVFDPEFSGNEELMSSQFAYRRDFLEEMQQQFPVAQHEDKEFYPNLLQALAANFLLAPEIVFKILEHAEREMQEYFEAFKEEYRGLVRQAMEEGWFPPVKDWERILERAHPTLYSTSQKSDGSINAGEYEWTHEGIFVNGMLGNIKEQTRKVVFHELNHQISGAVHVSHERGNDRLTRKKTGLIFYNIANASGDVLWLNEGVTEMLARRLAGQKEMHSYKREQEAVQELIDQGIDFTLFLQAYFEAYDAQGNDGYSAFRQLNDRIIQLKGNGWLLKIHEEVNTRDTK